MNFIDNPIVAKQLYPFTLTRDIADIRVGILTIRDKWMLALGSNYEAAIPSNLLPTPTNITSVKKEGGIKEYLDNVYINYPWNIFELNDWAIRQDFKLLTAGRISREIPISNSISHPENIFLEEGARVENCIINATTGPVYIGKNAEIMEGCMIRGPLAMCEGSVLKMGSKVYGATTLGPYCVGGGEIKNTVMFGFSNKGHDGYLGDSVIGEWCNLGAGTSSSNLKNNAGEVYVWNGYDDHKIVAGKKCGLLMGDYSRSAINTSFNTGTVTGVCCNIFGEGL
jgi:UDP-N-acetylglucosamine diphosphorylase/glucosamine-1-phosphate N-acetyltransferase